MGNLLAVPQPFLLAVCTSAHSTFMSSRVASFQVLPQFRFASPGMLTCELGRTHTPRHQLRRSQETLLGDVTEAAVKHASNPSLSLVFSRHHEHPTLRVSLSYHVVPCHNSSATLKKKQAAFLTLASKLVSGRGRVRDQKQNS